MADQLRTEIATLYPDGVPVSAAEGVSRLHRVPPPVRVGRVGPTRASGERTLGTLGKDRPGRAV